MNLKLLPSITFKIVLVALAYFIDFAWPLLRPILCLYLIWLGTKIASLVM
ncbi:hypothetical protein M899_0569 [Bacteriovorax sp. BSW11_IV]|nr:hypothetical protein [Bacteriovorax sp. BSW11_IV]EQC45080.1 hypothetical protein M899_0569 [Bacteriovorax sp. BSW11_IV]